MHLLTTILGGGMSSRLFNEIREKKGLAYSVYCYSQSHHDSGALVIYAGTEQKHCREVLDISLAEIHQIKQEPVPQHELDSAREQIKGKLLMSLESSENLMTRLAKAIIYHGQHQPIQTVLDDFDAVTVDDVQRIAQELFDDDCVNLELLGKTSETGITLDNVRL
jgi:predicted Zn-dependent peptidase